MHDLLLELVKRQKSFPLKQPSGYWSQSVEMLLSCVAAVHEADDQRIVTVKLNLLSMCAYKTKKKTVPSS